MTELYSKRERADNLVGVDAIAQEVRQFRKLQHLSNYDVAHRMAKSLNEVHTLRQQFNQEEHALYHTGIPYYVRVVLGEHGISSTGQLFDLSDREILALPRLGKGALLRIRSALQGYFQ